ncbi:hypothetical protein WJX84_001281 [Apatococcus fuscideae]|uniref:Uncharacterized protein n=1 Tax=Apatococcus fuscideae TaxID=2026836 RepID=A0AAW1SVU8_9CHLO
MQSLAKFPYPQAPCTAHAHTGQWQIVCGSECVLRPAPGGLSARLLRRPGHENLAWGVSRSPRRQQQCAVYRCRASSQAGSTIAAGQQKYKAGDRMGALKLFEDAVKQDPSIPERQSAHYHEMCVHASFGDVELAQISLRSGLNAGLDFEAALSNPDFIRMQASPQIAVQLKRFAAAARKIKSALQPSGPPRKAAAGGGSSAGQKPAELGSIPSAQDLASLFDTEKTGLDTSIAGIAKRVAILLLLLSALGVGLFFIGLKSFNQYQ